jgi:hypothetical protein
MPRPIESAPPQQADDGVANAHRPVELPSHTLPSVPAPDGGLEFVATGAPEDHPAPQALEHLPSLEAPTLPDVSLPEHAVAEIDPPMAHLPDFIFDLA